MEIQHPDQIWLISVATNVIHGNIWDKLLQATTKLSINARISLPTFQCGLIKNSVPVTLSKLASSAEEVLYDLTELSRKFGENNSYLWENLSVFNGYRNGCIIDNYSWDHSSYPPTNFGKICGVFQEQISRTMLHCDDIIEDFDNSREAASGFRKFAYTSAQTPMVKRNLEIDNSSDNYNSSAAAAAAASSAATAPTSQVLVSTNAQNSRTEHSQGTSAVCRNLANTTTKGSGTTYSPEINTSKDDAKSREDATAAKTTVEILGTEQSPETGDISKDYGKSQEILTVTPAACRKLTGRESQCSGKNDILKKHDKGSKHASVTTATAASGTSTRTVILSSRARRKRSYRSGKFPRYRTIIGTGEHQMALTRRWAEKTFRETVNFYLHVKIMQAYVESIPKYGGTGFQMFFLTPHKHFNEQLETALDKLFWESHRQGNTHPRLDQVEQSKKYENRPYILHKIDFWFLG